MLAASGEARKAEHGRSFILDELHNLLTPADSTQVKLLRFKRGGDIVARNQENGVFMKVHAIGHGKRTICFFLRNNKFNFLLLPDMNRAIEFSSISFFKFGLLSKIKMLGFENTSTSISIYTPFLRYFFQDGQQDPLDVEPSLLIADLLSAETSAKKIKDAWARGFPYWTLLNSWSSINENSQNYKTV